MTIAYIPEKKQQPFVVTKSMYTDSPRPYMVLFSISIQQLASCLHLSSSNTIKPHTCIVISVLLITVNCNIFYEKFASQRFRKLAHVHRSTKIEPAKLNLVVCENQRLKFYAVILSLSQLITYRKHDHIPMYNNIMGKRSC